MHRYRFARSPKWIFGHLIVLALVVGFVNAGLWQVRRLHQRRAFNATVERNEARPVSPLADVLTAHDGFGAVGPVLDRRVRVTGRYLPGQEILISGQSNTAGDPGAWIVSPLLQHDGTVVLVNRGWVSSTGNFKSAPATARPPAGEVTVEGLLTKTQTPGWFEAHDPAHGVLQSMIRVDVARMQKQIRQPVVPAFISRTSQVPADPGPIVPAPIDPPVLNDGPHLNYAYQWAAFTVLALVAYPILLRKVASDREKEERGRGANDDPYDDLPEGAVVDSEGVIDLTGVGAGSGNRST
ncbi:MAG TPA: SURF1 family protein [Acidimicrobiales bacterium]